jgi:hypothetical protein
MAVKATRFALLGMGLKALVVVGILFLLTAMLMFSMRPIWYIGGFSNEFLGFIIFSLGLILVVYGLMRLKS